MAAVLTLDGINAVRVNEREKLIRYKVTLSGSYVAAVRGTNTGELLTLNNVTGNYSPDQLWGQAGPVRGYINQGPGGFSAEILPGADALHWLLKIFGTTPGTELAAGTYAANAPSAAADLDFTIEFSGRRFD